jgi:cell division protein FtsN
MKRLHRPARGGFALGVVVGLLVGLAMALAVALYITRAPIPFINKVPPRTAEQDNAEAERNRHWDPNAPLGTKLPPRPVAASAPDTAASGLAAVPGVVPVPPVAPMASAASAAAPAARTAGRDPAAILAGGDSAPKPVADPFIYFVQTGAYTRSDDAEQQRARLALAGHTARISEREQAGRTVYRVRLGPLKSREDADGLQLRLQESGVESQIVRVEKP